MVPLWLLLPQIVAGSSMPGVLGYMFTSKRDMVKNKELCTSPVCQNRAEKILSSLDEAVNPCDDFYAYACGKSSSSSNTNYRPSAIQKIGGILESWPELTAAQNATEKAVMLYQACKRTYLNGKQELAAINKILDEEGYADWPLLTRKETEAKKFNTVEDVLFLTRAGGLFLVDVLPSLLINETNVLAMDAADLQHIPPIWTDDAFDNLDFRTSAEELNKIGQTCARMKAEILEIIKPVVNPENYGETTFATLESLVPSFSLLKIVNSIVKITNVTLRRDDHAISQLQTFTEYLKYLTQQNPDDIYNCQGMNRAMQLLSSLMRINPSEPIDVQEQWKQIFAMAAPTMCYPKVKIVAAPVLTRLYVLHESDIHLRRREARPVLNSIANALYTNLQFVPWLDRTTRRRAVLKLKNMTPILGFSDDVFNETILELAYANVRPLQQNDTMSEIYVEFERKNQATRFRYLRKGAELPRWGDGGYEDANAHYIPLSNSMVILDGILGGLYFDSGLPRYINLGSIGSVIGHELTHGFDSDGRRFDEAGKIFDWWSNYSSEVFEDKAACFVKQYGSIVDEMTEEPIDGKLTLVENIADNGGIRIAFKAFRTHELQSTEIGLSGLENFTSEQLFFISNALIWCETGTVAIGRYSAAKYRVNVPLQNMEEFSAAFQCKKGSHMRLGDHERCILW